MPKTLTPELEELYSVKEEAPIRTQIPDSAVLDRLFKGLEAPPSPQLEAPQPRREVEGSSRKELIARILLNVDLDYGPP